MNENMYCVTDIFTSTKWICEFQQEEHLRMLNKRELQFMKIDNW